MPLPAYSSGWLLSRCIGRVQFVLCIRTGDRWSCLLLVRIFFFQEMISFLIGQFVSCPAVGPLVCFFFLFRSNLSWNVEREKYFTVHGAGDAANKRLVHVRIKGVSCNSVHWNCSRRLAMWSGALDSPKHFSFWYVKLCRFYTAVLSPRTVEPWRQ